MPKVILLCDLSGSMEGEATDNKTRVQKLREAVKAHLATNPDSRVVCFNNAAWETKNISAEEPDGSTALHLGLAAVRELNPGHTIVISDGHPDDRGAALAEARQTPGVISAIYVGPDHDKGAIEFLNKLTRVGAGVAVLCDLRKTPDLIGALNRVLALPAPK